MGYGKCGNFFPKMATSTLKVATSSQKMATSMLKVASDIYKTPLYRMPTPLRTSQTSGHSSFCISDLPLRSLKPPSSRWLKSSFFICPRVSARSPHTFCAPPGGSPRQIAQNTPLKVYLTQFLNQYIIGLETNYRKG